MSFHRISHALILAIGVGALLLPGCASPPAELSIAERYPSRGTGKISDRFPNIPLTDQHGNLVHFYDDLVQGRTVIVNLMYTSCTGI